MKATKKAKDALARILDSFESGNVLAALARVAIPPLDVPCAHWSLSNRLLVFLSDTDDARGFYQWQEVGRRVRKDAKAVDVLYPIRVEKKRERGAKKEVAEDREEKMLVGFRAVSVFRFEDTEGEPLNHPPVLPAEPPPLKEVAEVWGIAVDYATIKRATYSYYAPGEKQIVLCTHDEEVFFRELAYAAHEKVQGMLKRGQDWKQEVAVELTAAMLAHLFGKRFNDDGAYRYIATYAQNAGKDVYQACMSVMADVERCLALIVGTTKTNLSVA